MLGVTALVVATLLGIGFGIFTGASAGSGGGGSGIVGHPFKGVVGRPFKGAAAGAAVVRAISIACLSLPPLITSLLLVFVAAAPDGSRSAA